MLVHDRCRASLGSNRVRLKENRRTVGFVIKKSRLRWYGHIERNVDASWIKCCMAMEVDGITGCLQLLEILEILEISWNLKTLLEILEISWILNGPPGNCMVNGFT